MPETPSTRPPHLGRIRRSPDPDQRFRVDLSWLCSSWTCIFGSGVQGHLCRPPGRRLLHLGAHFTDDERTSRGPGRRRRVDTEGSGRSGPRRDLVRTRCRWAVDRDGRGRPQTKGQEGACIFLNSPGFAGGGGCALHTTRVPHRSCTTHDEARCVLAVADPSLLSQRQASRRHLLPGDHDHRVRPPRVGCGVTTSTGTAPRTRRPTSARAGLPAATGASSSRSWARRRMPSWRFAVRPPDVDPHLSVRRSAQTAAAAGPPGDGGGEVHRWQAALSRWVAGRSRVPTCGARRRSMSWKNLASRPGRCHRRCHRGPASVGGCAGPSMSGAGRLPPPAIRLVCRGSPRRGTPPPARGGGARSLRGSGIGVIAGSAEALPLADASMDIAHARWAYFFGPGCERGLAEVDRVLRPGGLAVFVDNGVSAESTFSRWFAAACLPYDPEVERFWRRRFRDPAARHRVDLRAAGGSRRGHRHRVPARSGCPLRRRVHRPRRPGRTHRRLRHRPPELGPLGLVPWWRLLEGRRG